MDLGTDRAKADFISSSMKRTISEKLDENPALYKKLSELIEQVIQDFINGRYAEADYLNKVREIHGEMVNEGASKVPKDLADDPNAAAFHGYLLTSPLQGTGATDEDMTAFAKSVSNIFERHMIVDLFQRQDALNKIRIAIDDYIYDELKDAKGLELTTQQMDEIQESLMTIAERRLSK